MKAGRRRSCISFSTGSQKRAAGTLKRPSLGQLFVPEYRKTTIIAAAMFACSLGAAFGAIQQIPQIVPALAQVGAALPPPERQKIISGAVANRQLFNDRCLGPGADHPIGGGDFRRRARKTDGLPRSRASLPLAHPLDSALK